GSAFFLAYARSVDVGNRQITAVGQGNQLDTFRQLEVGHVYDLADFDVRQVDFDELRQVLRQAGHFDFVQVVQNLATLLLHANRAFLVDEVQGNVGGHFLAGDNANEVGVQDE